MTTKTKLLLALSMALCGCIDTRITTPQGLQISTLRFMWIGKIGNVTVSTNGTMALTGYGSENPQVIEAIASGIVKGLKP